MPSGSVTLGIHEIELDIISGDFVVTVDSVVENTGTLSISELAHNTGCELLIAAAPGASIGQKLKAELYYLNINDVSIFNLAEGFEAYLYNTGIGDNALITGAVLNNLRAGRQDVYHYNIAKGFDLYTDGTGNEIKVPIGKTCETAGYTLASTHLPGAFHNGAETGIELPASVSSIVAAASIPQPLYPGGFETDFSNVHYAFSNTETDKERTLLLYSAAQSGASLQKIYKCVGVVSILFGFDYTLADNFINWFLF